MLGVFRDFQIKNKLRAIILLTSGIVLLLASSAFVINDMLNFRQNMVADLFTLADLVGLNSSGGLLFSDKKTVEENMAALKVQPYITQAHVFNAENKLFASYVRQELAHLVRPPQNLSLYFPQPLSVGSAATGASNQIPEDAYFFHADHVEVFKPIYFKDGDMLGTVYIQSTLDAFNLRLYSAAKIVLAILAASLILAFLLASKLQELITSPIYSLLETMKQVSEHKNYALREQKFANDELGTLADAFNDMLVQVELRDKELIQYREHLEEKVTQRTTELAEARDQALAANKAKSVFLANMSHEIRTPMNAVLGYAQIMQRDTTLSKEQRESLQIIQNSGNHLLGLINDILDISKIEAGAMELRPENFYLNDLVKAISSMFKIRCEQNNLEWRVENNLPDPTPLYADQGKLRQIFINLLGNAVKFTETGYVLLRIDQEPDHVYRFSVIDTGPGIPPEHQASIFEPFQQEKSGYDKGGTGLGLAITKRQVDLMGGTLGLESTPGQGSCFYFSVRLEAAEGVIQSADDDHHTRIKRLADGHTVHALIVDDVHENRTILARMLAEIGVLVRMAENGQEGMHCIEQEKPDIVFTDIRMPVMDGMELIQRIHSTYRNDQLPCVAITASTLQHQSRKILEAGFDAFISKPFRFEAVYDCLREFLKVEFIYNDRTASESDLNTVAEEAEVDLNHLSLPADVLQRLKDAAELNELTEMEEIVSELQQGEAKHRMLGKMLADYLAAYDVDSILETLENVDVE